MLATLSLVSNSTMHSICNSMLLSAQAAQTKHLVQPHSSAVRTEPPIQTPLPSSLSTCTVSRPSTLMHNSYLKQVENGAARIWTSPSLQKAAMPVTPPQLLIFLLLRLKICRSSIYTWDASLLSDMSFCKYFPTHSCTDIICMATCSVCNEVPHVLFPHEFCLWCFS